MMCVPSGNSRVWKPLPNIRVSKLLTACEQMKGNNFLQHLFTHIQLLKSNSLDKLPCILKAFCNDDNDDDADNGNNAICEVHKISTFNLKTLTWMQVVNVQP